MVSTLMTVSEVSDAVESDVVDSILQIYIDAADEDIQRSAGPHDLARTVSRVIDYDNRAFDVLLPSRAESITSVTIDGDALDDSTYQLRYGGNSVRIWFLDPFVWTTGEYTRYSWPIVVNYTAVDDTNQRKLAMIQLVRMAVQHDGLAAERTGQYNRTSADYTKERNRILASLRPQTSRVA